MTVSSTSGPCACGVQRVCLAPSNEELLDEKGELRVPLPPSKWGCPACDVFQTFCIDDSVEGGIWDYISRDPADAAWAWLPEPMRAPLAKIGFTVGCWEFPPTSFRLYFHFRGETWVSDSKNAFSFRTKTADPTMPALDKWALGNLPGWRTFEQAAVSDPSTRADGIEVIQVGDVPLPASVVRAVAEMYPGASWEARGEPAPAVALLDGAPVAVVMPLAPLDGIVDVHGDKPHRCPTCGRIPDAVRATGGAVPGVVYECANDKTKWRLGAEEGRP